MKKFILGASLLVFALAAKSQCTPDTINCIDIDNPGQICPSILADGNVGLDYEANITILPPATYVFGTSAIEIGKITLDTIENMPPGLNYEGETMEFFPGQAYCVTVNGTPSMSGTYFLKIHVTPWIDLFNNGILVNVGTVIDSTSVSMTILPTSGINEIEEDGLSLIDAYPNPFSTSTKIGFLDNSHGETELIILNMLGRQVYQERIMAIQGENYFQFQGDDLLPGYYIYAILRDKKSLKGKLLKTK